MSHDPLIIAVVVGIQETRETLRDALENTSFTDLYQIGVIQGRLQGLKMAHNIIDDAAKAIDED